MLWILLEVYWGGICATWIHEGARGLVRTLVLGVWHIAEG